jgi:hypothetical protein
MPGTLPTATAYQFLTRFYACRARCEAGSGSGGSRLQQGLEPVTDLLVHFLYIDSRATSTHLHRCPKGHRWEDWYQGHNQRMTLSNAATTGGDEGLWAACVDPRASKQMILRLRKEIAAFTSSLRVSDATSIFSSALAPGPGVLKLMGLRCNFDLLIGPGPRA